MNSLSDILSLRSQAISYGVQSRGVIASYGVAAMLPQTVDITNGFNYQCKRVVDNYHAKIEIKSEQVRAYLETHPDVSNNNYRAWAIDKAWEMERVDVEWGGRGSENWNKAERAEILRRGRICQEKVEGKIVKEYPGHHQQSVAFHPEEQGNPDNIKFYRSREEHYEKGHFGDPHNESDAPMIDRGRMVEKTNLKRVIKNEVTGAGLTALISFVTAASLSFIIEIVHSGADPESVKKALKNAGRNGAEGAVLALTCYGISRMILTPATKAVSDLLTSLDLNVPNEVISGGIITAVAISVTSIYTYIKLRRAGIDVKESLLKVGQQALRSVSISVVVIYIGSKYGGVYGLIASITISAVLIAISVYKTKCEAALLERIKIYLTEHSYIDAKNKLNIYSPTISLR